RLEPVHDGNDVPGRWPEFYCAFDELSVLTFHRHVHDRAVVDRLHRGAWHNRDPFRGAGFDPHGAEHPEAKAAAAVRRLDPNLPRPCPGIDSRIDVRDSALQRVVGHGWQCDRRGGSYTDAREVALVEIADDPNGTQIRDHEELLTRTDDLSRVHRARDHEAVG